MKKLLFSLAVVIFLIQVAQAEQSMRHCMLLPILDSSDGKMGFQVFEKVEEYLKESTWCQYKSNSELINVLGAYKQNLALHLQNKEVLKVVAEKTAAGSLIKVELRPEMKGVAVKIIVIGENGEDIYFKEETRLDSQDAVLITQAIKNWLTNYEKNIPYDGRIIGILGDQFSIDTGRSTGLSVGGELSVFRMIKKRAHPLLKEIIDWETEKIAKAQTFNITPTQAQAKVTDYEGKKRLKIGDWVRLDKVVPESLENPPEAAYEKDEVKGYEFGKLGVASIGLMFGKGSIYNTTSSDVRQLGGILLGVDFNVEVWGTRNWWGAVQFMRALGSYSGEEGNLNSTQNSPGNAITSVKFGYRYLPLGFFYGPQIDGYVGYGNYSYNVDRKLSDGIVESEFKGIILGGRGSIPIDKLMRIFLGLDFMPFPGYDEEVKLYGKADSASTYHFQLGGSFLYSPSMSFEASWNFYQSKAIFENSSTESRFRNSYFKFATAFNF